MDEIEQRSYFLNSLRGLYRELGVYLMFAEVVKLIVGENEVDDMLAKVRQDPDLQNHVDSYFQVLSASLLQSSEIDPEMALQAFISQWNARSKPN